VRYAVLVDGELGAYGVVFPDAPGCTAMGSTIDEALVNAQEALQDWIAAMRDAGNEIPTARDMEALRQDPDVIEALASGSFFATVALVPAAGRTARVNISVDAGTLEFIDAEARRRKLTRSGLLERAVRDFAART
jgi:predicted RNase H-like HicB family nuclease